MSTTRGGGLRLSSLPDPSKKCSACGSSYLYDGTLQGAQARINELEDEIRQLQLPTPATASDPNYKLRAPSAADLPAVSPGVSTRPSTPGYFASFRSGLRGPSTPGDHSELQSALARETTLRQEAEKKVAEVNGEVEDLSATLFEQANEMVATERKARAKLEERLAVLEKRDKDKSRRLERIEAALRRLERVKTLLGT